MKKLFFAIGLFALIALSIENVGRAAAPEIDCDIQNGSCSKTVGENLTVAFDIAPKPVKPMENLTFLVELKKDGKIDGGAEIVMDLSMPGMYMGENVKALKFNPQSGKYEARGTLVRCGSGRRDWKAAVTVKLAGTTYKTFFTFETTK